jgi:photosynthetic reaction center cytochrome c subunit
MRTTKYFFQSAIVFLVVIAAALPAASQVAPTGQPVMVEDVFKNVQVLKGIPVNQFMETMGFFAASLGLNCTGCHAAESLQDWAKFADDVPRKVTARRMIRMVDTINKTQFAGARMLTCWSCHRGTQLPEVVPSLAAQYEVADEDPNSLEIVPDGPKEPTAVQILNKYIDAVGGNTKLQNLKSYVAKGTLEGFDTYHQKVPLEIDVKAPRQRTIIWHGQNGDSSTVFNGTAGWIAQVSNPVRLIPMMPGAELDGAKFDANVALPVGFQQALSDWRVGIPPTTIDDKVVNVVQGTGVDKTKFKLYFEDESGLLVRQVRYSDTPIGMVPLQIDYSDYRDVAGIKLPYKIVITWTDGRSNIELSEIQPNATIDAAKFAKPAPPAVK